MREKSSPPQSTTRRLAQSTEIINKSFTAVPSQPNLFADNPGPLPGSMNDASEIKAALASALHQCGKSRETVADEMSSLTGMNVTARRLNAFTAESREDHHFPLELLRAFCFSTGDSTLLRRIAELSGYRLVNESEYDLLKLGREYLKQKRAIDQVALLEKRLQGVEL